MKHMNMFHKYLAPYLFVFCVLGSIIIPILFATHLWGSSSTIQVSGRGLLYPFFLVSMIASASSGFLFFRSMNRYSKSKPHVQKYPDNNIDNFLLGVSKNKSILHSLGELLRGYPSFSLVYSSIKIQYQRFFILFNSILTFLLIISIYGGIPKKLKIPEYFAIDNFHWDILFFYILNCFFGIVLAYGWFLVEFNSRYARKNSVWYGAVFVLTITSLVILVDFIGVKTTNHSRHFYVLIISFVLWYLFLMNRRLLQKTRIGVNFPYIFNLSYFNDILESERRPFLRITFLCLKHNFSHIAYFLLAFHEYWKTSRGNYIEADCYLLVLKAMVYQKLGRFYNVLDIARDGNAAIIEQHRYSDHMLIGFKALAYLRMGQGEEAKDILNYGKDRFPNNPYHLLNLAYVYWQKSDLLDWKKNDLFKAIDSIREARNYTEREQTDLALIFEAHLLCDLTLSEYKGNNNNLLYENIDEAYDLLMKVVYQKDDVKSLWTTYFEDQLNYTLGYVYLLRGEFEKASKLFSGCIWRHSHLRSRFYVGLLHMVGTKKYTTAILQFEKILDIMKLRSRWQGLSQRRPIMRNRSRFGRMVEMNLSRAREAKGRYAFNSKIIYYHLNFDEDIPKNATLKEEEYEQYRKRFGKFVNFELFPYRYFKNIKKIVETGRITEDMTGSSVEGADFSEDF